MANEIEQKLDKIVELSGVSKEEVLQIFEAKKKETTEQLGLSEADAIPIATNKTRVYYKKKMISKSLSKDFVIVGQYNSSVDWAKNYKNQVREFIKQYGKEAAVSLGAITSDEKKYFYKTLDPKKIMLDWKDGKEVPDSEYNATFIIVDNEGKTFHYVVKSEKTESMLNSNLFSVAAINYVASKKEEGKIYETDEPVIKSKLDDVDTEKLLLGYYKDFIKTPDQAIELCKNQKVEMVLIRNCTIMNMYLSKAADKSSAIILDVDKDDVSSATVYFAPKTKMNVTEGVPVTILAETGYYDKEKGKVNLQGIAYYIEPKFRQKIIVNKISEAEKSGVF